MTEMQLAQNGGPAFPVDVAPTVRGRSFRYAGMTLKDYFAAAALTGLLARHGQRLDDNGMTLIEPVYNDENAGSATGLADQAYWIANAMLEARHAELNPDERIGGDA